MRHKIPAVGMRGPDVFRDRVPVGPPLALGHLRHGETDRGDGHLTKIDWINPHIVIAMDAKSDGGKIDRWTFESNPPSWYRSVGLARADFAKALGQTVTVEGLPARDGTLFGYMQKITLPDGTSLELVNSAEVRSSRSENMANDSSVPSRARC